MKRKEADNSTGTGSAPDRDIAVCWGVVAVQDAVWRVVSMSTHAPFSVMARRARQVWRISTAVWNPLFGHKVKLFAVP